MPYDPKDPDSAEPGELLDVILDELDVALSGVAALPKKYVEKASLIVADMIRSARAMQRQLASKKTTPRKADNFARRCRQVLDIIFRNKTAQCDPMATRPARRRPRR